MNLFFVNLKRFDVPRQQGGCVLLAIREIGLIGLLMKALKQAWER